MPSFIHLANAQPDPRIWTLPFRQALEELGPLTIVENAGAMTDQERAALARQHDIGLAGWNAAMFPALLAADPGRLRYICNITGELRRFVPIELVEAGIAVTNWGDYPAEGVAEGALTLLLAVLKDLHDQILHVRGGGWKMDMHVHGGSLEDITLGVYGCGVIGRRFIEMVAPFRCRILVFDPYAAELPPRCERAQTLDQLFSESRAVVIHAALNDQTRKSVTAAHLARLPRGGVVINTARGGIIDQDALFAELQSGRLRAGLDVLEPDELAADHPARMWPNLILTAHRVDHGWPDYNEPPTTVNKMQRICLDNVRRFLAREPMRFAFDRERYLRST